jgi:hypothetical protein
MVEQYLLNTHAQTHNQYNMEVVDVFAVQHQKENFVDVGNRCSILVTLKQFI